MITSAGHTIAQMPHPVHFTGSMSSFPLNLSATCGGPNGYFFVTGGSNNVLNISVNADPILFLFLLLVSDDFGSFDKLLTSKQL